MLKLILSVLGLIALSHLLSWGVKTWAKYWPTLAVVFACLVCTAGAQEPSPDPDPTPEEWTATLVAVLVGVKLAEVCFNRVKMYV